MSAGGGDQSTAREDDVAGFISVIGAAGRLCYGCDGICGLIKCVGHDWTVDDIGADFFRGASYLDFLKRSCSTTACKIRLSHRHTSQTCVRLSDRQTDELLQDPSRM